MSYLKDTKNKVKFVIVIFFSLSLCLSVFFNYSQAETTTDQLNAEKTTTQQKLTELNKQIKNYQQQIANTQAKSSTLKNEISIYNNQISSNELQIQAKETQITDTRLQISELQKLIEKKTQEIQDNRRILAQLIVEINQFDDQYALKTTIGSKKLSDFLDQIEYNQNLQEKVNQLVKKIKDLKLKLQNQQHELELQVAQLEEYKNQLQITRDSLASIRSQKQKLLSQTQGLEKNFQKLLTSSKKDADNLQKEISDLDAQIRAKLGKKTISASKGVLAWPMDGIITQKYGNTGFTALGYNFHNGIDVAAPAGQPIYAAADGEVIHTDRSNATYGNWVALKHNIATKNGNSQIITLYAHMQNFKVKIGQRLSQGDLIGYEGNTGNTTAKLYGPERGFHIHFVVYDAEGFGVKSGAYTNIYGNYQIPFGYTYNPMDFLGSN